MKKLFLISAIFAFTSIANASVVWDASPVTTGGTVTSDFFTNVRPGQYFAESVSFSSSTVVNGIDIYSSSSYGALGSAAVVSIWSSGAGIPGALAAQYHTTISAVDTVGAYAGEHLLHADFADFNMIAGLTYWIGMAGDTVTFTQTGLRGVAGGDGMTWRFNSGDTGGVGAQDVGDMAFRLEGNGGSVPEPESLALVGLALAGLGFTRRKAKQA